MSAWDQERAAGLAPRHALGVWLTYRKLATAAYVPGERSRLPLRHKTRFDYAVNFSLTARLNAEDRIVTADDFYLLTLVGSSVDSVTGLPIAAGFRVQLYDTSRKQRLGDPLNFANYLGNGRQPHILRKPYRFAKNTPILIRVQNSDVSGSTNNIQVVLGGVGE
jgi:hypothetical protein